MKRHYSYFLIKPDGIRYLDEICSTLEEKFESIRYYAVPNFEDTIKALYYKHYETKGTSFAKSFESYLYGLINLFGNETILALISDRNKTYDELARDVFETKIEVRKKYVNNRIGIITNYGKGEKNYIRFLETDGRQGLPRIMQELGNYRVNDMNIIHSPDSNPHITLEELNILLQLGIIDDKNLITENMLIQMRKYETVKFQRDMRKPNYQSEQKPDISGFIKADIENLEESERG